MMVSRYLFQSWVNASEGGFAADGGIPGLAGGGAWMGIESVRWFDAEAGVRRSNIRSWESDDTLERI